MRKSLFLVVLGLLASAWYPAPCIGATAADQVAFSTTPDRVAAPRIGGTVRSASELDAQMQQVINREMPISYYQGDYVDEVEQQFCSEILDCSVYVLSQPRIELIPTRSLGPDIYCNVPGGCIKGYHEEEMVSTTHSLEVGYSAEVGAKPFGVGVAFTVTTTYGFSKTKQESTTLSYEFNLQQGDFGYIGMVNAQITAKLWLRGCWCPGKGNHLIELICRSTCRSSPQFNVDEIGYHESVIVQGNKPRGIVAFVYR
ncbi:hypothetical protein BGX24_006343 [Mortierella sp. AD032]|nr:hypothetical protein BGX24_006343 [Mortierella sp. AD032]